MAAKRASIRSSHADAREEFARQRQFLFTEQGYAHRAEYLD